jgi:hypothetical protein
MNTQEIQYQLKDYKAFVGVFPCDRLPSLKPGQAMIVNTDPHTKPGQHWVAFYKTKSMDLEYFDSFGLPPLVSHLKNYINMGAHNHFTYSTVQLQHESSQTCGNHCISFVKHRLLDQPFASLLAHFSSLLLNNDRKVYSATEWGMRK